MKDHTNGDKGRKARSEDVRGEQTVAILMNLAGARSAIPHIIESRIYDRVKREWRDATVRTSAKRWLVPIGLAASLLIAFALLLMTNRAPPQPLGTIARIAGEATSQQSKLNVNEVVYTGDTIRIKEGRGMGISLRDGGSLRLAENTVLHLDSTTGFTLEHGRVYVDSGRPTRETGGVTIHTAMGAATDHGTQFAVLYDDGQFTVAVREGTVNVAADGSDYSALAGDQITIRASGDVNIDDIAANDSSWSWATELAPDFDITGRSLLDFLLWAVRETGHELVFPSDEIRAEATTTVLHGSVEGFTPHEAIEAVLATTSFDYNIQGGRLLIGK